MLTEGMDVTLAATGIMVEEALKAQKLLAKDGISARVLDVHTIKPLDAEAITAAAERNRGDCGRRGTQHSWRAWWSNC